MQEPVDQNQSSDKAQLSLFELNSLIRETLQRTLEPYYWVVAEVGEMRVNQKGHCYMELVEKEHERIIAKARATVWARDFYNISSWFESLTGQPLKAGMKILARVTVSFHELYGLSVNVKDIDPQYTLGERARRRQEVINQLLEEGVYDMNRELSLTSFPQNIAIISSSTAAGFGDFIDQLHNNPQGYIFNTRLFRAIMQGDQAPLSIIAAMHEVYQRLEEFDALVIIRGGGAQSDLDCFDSYDVAAHVAQFPIPVISGIGHERDETITDLVAHTRMKTPTAVAEFLLSSAKQLDEKLNDLAFRAASFSLQYLRDQQHFVDQLTQRLAHNTRHLMTQEKHKAERLGHDLRHAVRQMVNRENSKMMGMQQSLAYAVKHHLTRETSKIEKLEEQLKEAPVEHIQNEIQRLEQLEKNLTLLDPVNVLKRGYSITTLNGKILREVDEVREGDELITKTDKQLVKSRVEGEPESGKESL